MNSDGLNANMSFRLPVLTLRKVEIIFDCNTPEVLFCCSGIPNVIDSYAKFRRLLRLRAADLTETDHPQLLICGHGAVDDPDASIIYDQVMKLINSESYVEFAKDIVVMRLPPSDQRKSISPDALAELLLTLDSAQCFDGECQNCPAAVHS